MMGRATAFQQARRRSFALKNAAIATADMPARESAYRGALALWDREHPGATQVEREAEARRLRRVHRV